jgi:uncharacterized membrane protein YfcA
MDLFHLLLLIGIGVLSFGLALFGAAVGLVLGHLRLPLLVYCLGSPVVGAATNLAISGLGALSGSWRHLREGRVSLQMLALMGIPSAIGAALGVYAVWDIDPGWGKVFIGALLVFSGINLTRARGLDVPSRVPRRLLLLIEMVIGLVLGVLAGVIGLMMGSLRLATMIRLLHVDTAVAVGTNMTIGCLTAIVGSAVAWNIEGADVLAIAIVGPPTLLGGYIGARLTHRLPKEKLRRLVGWTIAVSGLLMTGDGIWELLGTEPWAM